VALEINQIAGNITIVTTAKNDDQARELLRHFGVPFRQPGAGKGAGAAR